MTFKKETASKLIDLRSTLPMTGLPGMFFHAMVPALERMLSIQLLNAIYDEVHGELTDTENDPDFFMKTLKAMGVHFEIDALAYKRIPEKGPLLVVSNHPFGGIDGVGSRCDASEHPPGSQIDGKLFAFEDRRDTR